MSEEKLMRFFKEYQEKTEGKNIWENTASAKATEPTIHHYPDTEFASQVLTEIPYGWVDKTSCGCGFTSVALRSAKGTIVVVPAVVLIVNKKDNESNDSLFGVYGDITTEQVDEHVENYPNGKIMVTYDSIHKCRSAIEAGWDIVVDESDKVFSLKSLKAKSKKSFYDDCAMTRMMKILYLNRERVSFISATPVDRNLYMPDWVKELPYHKFVFNFKLNAINLVHDFNSLSYIKDYVVKPLLENGEASIEEGASFKKAVIFLNSVKAIEDIVESYGLSENNAAYISAETTHNSLKLKNIPRLDNNHKSLPLLTFITSSGFQGIDLHDEEAASFIVADGSSESLHIDFATDIKQAASRIRTKTNPFYNKIYVVLSKNLNVESVEERYNKTIEGYNKAKAFYELIKGKDISEIKEVLSFIEDIDKEKVTYKYFYTVNNKIVMDEHPLIEQEYNGFNRKKYLFKGDSELIKFTGDDSLDIKIIPNIRTKEEIKEINQLKTFKDYAKFYNECKKKDKESKVEWPTIATNKKWIMVAEHCWFVAGKVYQNIVMCTEAINKSVMPTEELFKASLLEVVKVGNEYTHSELSELLNKASKVVDGWLPKYSVEKIIMEYFEITKRRTNSARLIKIVSKRK